MQTGEDKRGAGYGSGLLAVLMFSGSLPATKIAEIGFPPLLLTALRGVIAALIALSVLLWLKQTRPGRQDVPRLLIVAAGAVIGFPLLTALALYTIDTAHSILWTALLPLATAIFGVVRGRETPAPIFWLFSVGGAAIVVGFVLTTDRGGWAIGDLYMLLAILVCGLAYAEGAALSRRLGGWQVICWALVLSLPATACLLLLEWPATTLAVTPATIPASAWAGLAYVVLFSMLLGFVFWYRGLAAGGTARVAQLQLLQPLAGLALCGAVLREPVPPGLIVVALAAILCVGGARKFA